MLVRDRRIANDFIEWTDVDISEHFKNKQTIHSSDDILFPTIVETVNSLMQSSMKGYQQGYFTPRGLDSKYKFWFPQLEIEGKAQARGWHNILSEDGTTITEYNDDIKTNTVNWENVSRKEFLDYTRVTFTKVRDPITNKRAYKFVGLFEFKDIDDSDVRTYVKTSDTFEASKHKVAVKWP
jgi:hypothetical protein